MPSSTRARPGLSIQASLVRSAPVLPKLDTSNLCTTPSASIVNTSVSVAVCTPSSFNGSVVSTTWSLLSASLTLMATLPFLPICIRFLNIASALSTVKNSISPPWKSLVPNKSDLLIAICPIISVPLYAFILPPALSVVPLLISEITALRLPASLLIAKIFPPAVSSVKDDGSSSPIPTLPSLLITIRVSVLRLPAGVVSKRSFPGADVVVGAPSVSAETSAKGGIACNGFGLKGFITPLKRTPPNLVPSAETGVVTPIALTKSKSMSSFKSAPPSLEKITSSEF